MQDITIKQRLARLRHRMTDDGVDLLVLGPGTYVEWLLGFHPYPDERLSLLLVGRQQAMFVMPALNAADTQARSDLPLATWTDAQGPAQALQTALAATCPPVTPLRVGLDEAMRTDFALAVLDRLPGANVVMARDVAGAARMLKDEEEYRLLKENAAIADRAMLHALATMRPGITEAEVAEGIAGAFAAEGAKVKFAVVATGPNGALPHHHTGAAVLSPGDAVVIDIGARRDGYCSDITRMAVLEHEPGGYAEIHAIVEAAVQAALKAARPGATASSVDRAARRVIEQAGYGPYFVHRTGHGLGMEGHEAPFITETSETILEAGMVFSIEPGIYLPGRFGIRLEEIVFLRDDGPEILSGLPRTLSVIPPHGQDQTDDR
ncbi:M24 family metallopeptidase [Gluconacetobacter sp.]|uniref:M24 family metallopeptidase n=1 Tax=Gluconacetobacter sp. TaxID=1935994 RepID=UPI0039E9C6D9